MAPDRVALLHLLRARSGLLRLFVADLPSVYALSLLLVTVSVNGIYNSFRQWWTGRKPVFQRTPKIRERTAMPASYVIVTWLIPPATLLIAVVDLDQGFPPDGSARTFQYCGSEHGSDAIHRAARGLGGPKNRHLP